MYRVFVKMLVISSFCCVSVPCAPLGTGEMESLWFSEEYVFSTLILVQTPRAWLSLTGIRGSKLCTEPVIASSWTGVVSGRLWPLLFCHYSQPLVWPLGFTFFERQRKTRNDQKKPHNS